MYLGIKLMEHQIGL